VITGTTRAILCELRMVNVIVLEVGYIIHDEELTEGLRYRDVYAAG